MASTFNPGFVMEVMLDKLHTTPMRLDASQISAVTVHAALGGLSTAAVLIFLIHCAVVAYYNRRNKDDDNGERIFIFTQLGYYVVCLMVSDLLQGLAGLLQAGWVINRSITEGPLCTAQGIILQTGGLGNAVFTSVIAVHTLFTLVLRRSFPHWVVMVVIGVAWVVILFLDLAIPAITQVPENGPYYGNAGAWCSITPGYPLARIFIHYVPILLSAFICIVLYLAIFFYLRGNLVVENGRVTFRIAQPKANLWIGESPDEEYRQFLGNVAYKMLWYPIVYLTLTLPLVSVRLASMTGMVIPFPVWIFAGICVSIMGLANLIVLVTTRKVIGPFPFLKRFSGLRTLVGESDKKGPMSDKGFRESFSSKEQPKTPKTYNGTSAPAAEWQDRLPKSADFASRLSPNGPPAIAGRAQRLAASSHRPTASLDSRGGLPSGPRPQRKMYVEAQRELPTSPLTGDLGARPRRNSDPQADNRFSDVTIVGDDRDEKGMHDARQKMREADSIIGLYSQRTIKGQGNLDRGRTLTRTPGAGDVPQLPAYTRIDENRSRSRGARFV